jgi:acyl carrier protein
MHLEDNLKQIMSKVLRVPLESVETCSVLTTETWDSLATMQIVSEIEENLSIEFQMQDVLNINSYKKVHEIVSKITNQN